LVIFRLIVPATDVNGFLGEWTKLSEFFLKDLYQTGLAIIMVLALVLAYIKRDLIFQLLDIDKNYIHPQNWRGEAAGTRFFHVIVWCVEPEFRTMLGKTCNMFLRIAYGHNEPGHSRVHTIENLRQVPERFGDTFSLTEQTESEWGGGLPSLYVEVKNQEFLGSDVLGIFIFDAEDIREELDDMESTRMEDPAWATLEDEALRWSTLQAAIMTPTPTETITKSGEKGEERRKLKKLGFKPFTLSAHSEIGGYIWLTFYEEKPKTWLSGLSQARKWFSGLV
jgi:hypothetical protein